VRERERERERMNINSKTGIFMKELTKMFDSDE
jgi:hypothetical protein